MTSLVTSEQLRVGLYCTHFYYYCTCYIDIHVQYRRIALYTIICILCTIILYELYTIQYSLMCDVIFVHIIRLIVLFYIFIIMLFM
jgi:hypothetical protein